MVILKRKFRNSCDPDSLEKTSSQLPNSEYSSLHPNGLLAEYPLPDWFSKLRSKSVTWFNKHQRDLPWRENNTPYRVWISEIMLQQTQVQTVIDYFLRFLKHFPTIESLANASESQVLLLWEGLGYYRRARSLHQAAKQICELHRCRFPENFDQVLGLPGIGRYTAGAILSIALDQKHPILEGNTYRLYSRLLGLTLDPRECESEKLLWKFATDLLPGPRSKIRAGTLNQAMMEIGSEVCKVKNPKCQACPLKTICAAFQLGLEKDIPKTKSKTVYEDRHQALFLIEDEKGNFLVRQRGVGEWWSGLWDFVRVDIPHSPDHSWHDKITDDLRGEFGLKMSIPNQPDFILKHAVTRFRIQLSCYHLKNVKPKRTGDHHAEPLTTLNNLPFNITARKALDRILKTNQK